MPAAIRIVHLADVPEVIPVLAGWFTAEWEPYYGPAGPGDAARDLESCRNRDEIPLALVALDAEGEVAGTAALKPHSLDTHRHLGPWLAAILVSPERRGQGIGAALVAAIEDEARRLGFGSLYTATDDFSGLLRRRGWAAVAEDVPTLREPTTVYRLRL